MASRENAERSFIAITFLVALVFSIVALPEWARPARPEFVAMMLIYWCVSTPERVGIGFAWFVGIVMDVAHGVLLGQHALTFSLVAWATLKLHQRIRLFPIWQQALSVFLLIVLSQMLTLWIKGMAGQPPETWTYWLPSVSSFVLWPWFFLLMRGTRRYFLGTL